MIAGATQLTRTPVVASSFASDLVNEMHRRLRRRVRGAERIAFLARDRPQVHDAPVTRLDHVAGDRAAREERADHVDVEDAPPLGERRIDDRRLRRGDARGVDEDVDAPASRHRVRRRTRDRRLVGDVERGTSSRPAAPRAARSRLGCVAVPQHHGRARRGHALRGRETDAAGATGDDGHAAVEVDAVHGGL